MPTYYNGNPNFPTPSRNISNDYTTFPNDLIIDKRNFYCDINFVEYNYAMQLTSSAIPTIPKGGLRLPIPKKLNDVQTLVWGEREFTKELQSTAYQIAGTQSIFTGRTLNPMLFMQFQRPNYKEFVLSWSFTPNNEKESMTLRKIIETFKYRSLPQQQLKGLLKYPDIALVKLWPDDEFTFKFRPCAVMSVSVDYTGAGMPSFFKKTGAPTVVNLNVQLKEIQLWDKTNYDGGPGVSMGDELKDLFNIINLSDSKVESAGPTPITNGLPGFAG